MKCSEEANPYRQKRMNGCQVMGEGKWGLTTNEDRVSLWNDRNVLKLDSDNDCYRRMVALHKSDTQIREVFHTPKGKEKGCHPLL